MNRNGHGLAVGGVVPFTARRSGPGERGLATAQHFVGREAELAVLAAEWDAARRGERRLVVVRGATGSGKTWLCARAAERAEADGLTVAGPLLMVLDDVQSGNTDAVAFAQHVVARNLAGALIVMTWRTEDENGDGRELLDTIERDAAVVELGPFDAPDTAALLAAHGLAATEATIATLHRLTSGSPRLLGRAVVGANDVETAVERAVAAAAAALTDDQRRLLAMAAVLGAAPYTDDVAAVAGCDLAVANAALAAASAHGLMRPGPRGWSFVDPAVRRRALASLTPLECQDAHAAAAAIAGTDHHPDAALRRARYSLVAASRSDADAAIAVGICQRSARVMRDHWHYGDAVALLESAVALAERLWPPDRFVDLLLDYGEALLASGRLADARRTFDGCVAATQSAGDALALARAALGLGGVWLNEDRGEAERARMLGLVSAALAGLPADEVGLQARLRCRLAAEGVYHGHPVEPVRDALRAARQVADPRVLAEVLSLTHHALLAPEHLAERLPIAEELIAIAAASGDGVGTAFGLLWKAVDLLHLGDVRADRAVSEVRERAEAIDCRSVAYIVAAIDVMRLIRDGRLDAAEAAAGACFELGSDVGDADATGYYAAHLLTIRWLQDRDGELLDLARDIASSSTLIAPEFAFRAARAAIAARAGHRDDARVALRQLGPLAELPRSSSWLIGMVIAIEAAHLLGDVDVAREAAALIEPYADRPAVGSLGVSCFGSVERALGLAAQAWGDADLAVTRLARAVDDNLALGNRPFAAIARAELAAALLDRDEPGDRAQAGALLTQAADAAGRLGMAAREEPWRRRAGEVSMADDDTTTAVLRRDGDRWIIEAGRRRIEAPDLVGFGYLGSLLSRPGEEIPAVDLCGGADVRSAPHDVIDRRTVEAYQRRVGEIDQLLDRAHRRGRRDRVDELEHERERLRAELSATLGRVGRSRRFTDAGERARTAVRKAITRAIDVVGNADRMLAAELRATVTTGRRCVYTPDPGRPRHWTFRPA